VTIESGQSAEIDFAITAAECGATTE